MLHALALAAEGIEIMLTSGEEEAYPLIDGDEMELELPRGSLFSVLGLRISPASRLAMCVIRSQAFLCPSARRVPSPTLLKVRSPYRSPQAERC